MAILEFRATTTKAAALNKEGAGLFAGGQFVVVARFDAADAARYEYRQYIKGTAIMQQGSFGGTPASMDNWVIKPGTVPEDGKDLFLIPGGLHTSFREDGLVRVGITKIATRRTKSRARNTVCAIPGAFGHRPAAWVCA